MGHEGNLGIITEAVIRVREIPEVRTYGSIIFPDLENGIQYMHDVARSKLWPASIRLVDNAQFQFGQALKTESDSRFAAIIDEIKKYYVLNIKGFNPNKMVACTLLFEGSTETTRVQEKSAYKLAKYHGGMKAGEENGIRGYFLTYVIAYIRDFTCEFNFIAESFETSVPWDKTSSLIKNVNEKIRDTCAEFGIIGNRVFVSSRVTQVYETGSCVYIYFGFNAMGVKQPMEIYEKVEHDAREEILRSGGSISHHHGIGKLRAGFAKQVMSPIGIDLMRDIKKSWDPQNIFAGNNTVEAETKR